MDWLVVYCSIVSCGILDLDKPPQLQDPKKYEQLG